MQIAIIGNTFSGKTTLFNLLTDNIINLKRKDKIANINKGKSKVLDKRIDILSEIYKPEKTTYPEIEYIDIAGINTKEKDTLDRILHLSKDSDIYLLTIGVFNSENPAEVIQEFINNFILLDINVIENRLQRIDSQIKKQKDKKQLKEEQTILEKINENLNKDIPIYLQDLTENQLNLISGYKFYSQKEVIPIINIPESLLSEEESLLKEKDLKNVLDTYKLKPIIASLKLELELKNMQEEERQEIMQLYDLEKIHKDDIIEESYKKLSLIKFFTVGKDEVRGWPIKENTRVQKAAGKIHTDLEKGFIKAEVINYQEFIKYKDMKECKKSGLVREEGKDYIVKDGDIINIKFNI